ncbi:MAG: glycosyltransferase [Ignavibacteriae bacterium]|nr:glycosyltransferase [Ignavibacteriota bacterium]
MAHIAIDARKYFDFGIGTYIQCLAGALSKLSTAHTFSLYVAPHDAARIVPPDGWKMRSVPYGKYSVSEFMLFGFRVRRDGVQLFHEPHYTLPAGLKGRSVVTIQDLAQLRLPQYFTPLQRAYAHFMIQHALRHAGAVLTTSQFTRHDIMDKFGLDASRVIVVPLGIRDVFQPISDTQRLDRFRVRNGLEKPYILYVGNMVVKQQTWIFSTTSMILDG